MKFNSEGKLKWKKVVNIYTRDLGTSIVIHDGFFYITGVTDYEFNIKKLFLIKYDLDGKQKWFKIWDKSDQNIGTDIVIDNEEIFVSGDCGIDSGAHQRFGMLLLKYNLDGDLILENTWPSKRNWGGNHTNSIISYNNNLYIAGYWDMRIIKCDHYGGNKNKNSIKKPSIIIINILKKFIDRLPVLKSIFY